MIATLQFPSEPESVTAARHYVGQALAGCPGQLVDAAQLMVSELATNAIRHARTGFTLTIEQTPHRVHVEVSDTGRGQPAVRSPAVTEPNGPRAAHRTDLLGRVGRSFPPGPARQDGVVFAEHPARGPACGRW